MDSEVAPKYGRRSRSGAAIEAEHTEVKVRDLSPLQKQFRQTGVHLLEGQSI